VALALAVMADWISEVGCVVMMMTIENELT
jgi:hypothetical protein